MLAFVGALWRCLQGRVLGLLSPFCFVLLASITEY